MVKKESCKGKDKEDNSGSQAGVFVNLKEFYHLYSSPAKNWRGSPGVYDFPHDAEVAEVA